MLNAMSSLPFWEGHVVDSITELDEGSLLITLDAAPEAEALCGACRQACALVHERRWRQVRDRDILDRRVWIKVAVRRLDCHHCGARVAEHITWLDRRSRMTHRVRIWVESLVQMLPIAHVAKLTGLHWHTIKAIDLRRLEHLHGEFSAPEVRRLVMDEFALHKGHRYATVVMDAQRMRVLWVGEGNSRAAIRPFFELLGTEGCARIEAVAMDMNTAMDLEVREHCPNAEVVYDLFHVVARFGRDVVDRVRVDQANALRADPKGRQIIKRSRWLLLRNRDNLDDDHAVKLEELLAANVPLATVYLLKTELKEIWYAPSVREGARRWKRWMKLARDSEIAPVIQFAKRLRKYVRGIIASAIYPMNSSILEGVNNRIKVIKRMAYGFRDSAYFFLKIKDAFPGKVR
ncbi:MAG: ISL3 family transposase [Janthinobacterium svalbardensis]|uniref:ISL3 family transposase n=1 Tax=Janthinobacterium svalbardensis TaxID=368607 RepID=A0A290WQQ6_9BURK|nr:ISL3 family transposase [Janthinobacterium svalbardensis]ATD60426.1 ISL3 family transposase [Janthinobacterium svalbardensis]